MRTSVLLAVLLAAATAQADEASEARLLQRIEQLEQRIQDLEANPPAAAAPRTAGGAGWADYVRLGASANTGYYGGEKNAVVHPDGFRIWDARLFVDAELGRDVSVGETTLFRNLGFSFEWDLVRIGQLRNQVGNLYVDFQGFLAQEAFNFQAGRFQIPVGEAYLRYSEGYAHKPFVSSPVGGPWWWDEGIRFYGSTDSGRIGYVASISDGETPFNADANGGEQYTLKLIWRPASWLHLSASGLRSGSIGSNSSPANGALWLGETWARAFGSATSVPSYQDGAPVADGPGRLAQTWLAAGDVVIDLQDKLRVWLAYGHYAIDSSGGSFYDRELDYWIAEAILRGAWLSETLRPFYLGLRASALGTYDADEGYLLDFRQASSIGYNAKSLTAYSAVLGWELNEDVRLRVEYTHNDVDVVRGVTDAIRNAAEDVDSFAVEVGASF